MTLLGHAVIQVVKMIRFFVCVPFLPFTFIYLVYCSTIFDSNESKHVEEGNKYVQRALVFYRNFSSVEGLILALFFFSLT